MGGGGGGVVIKGETTVKMVIARLTVFSFFNIRYGPLHREGGSINNCAGGGGVTL